MTDSDPGIQPDTSGNAQFRIEHIYLKDCSFESPLAPGIFSEQFDSPDANVNLQTKVNALTERPEAHEVVLSVSFEAKSGERSLFVCEVHMAAVVALGNDGQVDQGRVLGARVPEILFPYVREAVSDLVVRGGFLPVMLQPIDFDTVYSQRSAQQGRPLDA